MSSGENWKAQEYFFCGDDFVIIYFFPGFLEIASCGTSQRLMSGSINWLMNAQTIDSTLLFLVNSTTIRSSIE